MAQENTKTIAFVIGSLRKGSFNKQLAKEAEKMIGDRAKVVYVSTDLPLMNQDIEFPAPAAVQEARKTLQSVDGVWFFSPEYNHSYSAPMKNFVDWMSRSLEQGKMDNVTTGLKATASSVASGSAGQHSLADLKKLLEFSYVGMDVASMPMMGITANSEAWTTGTLMLNDEQTAALRKQVDDFLAYLG